MNSFHLATIPLAEPVTVYLLAGPRPRIVPPEDAAQPAETTAETGSPLVLTELDCAFWINVVSQTIHAQIAQIPRPLPLYSAADFHAVSADLPEHHAARVLQVLGSDPATVLQALCDGLPLPPPPVRVPREIANWRARAVLELAGLLPTVEAAISAMEGAPGIIVRTAWQSGAPLARKGPTVSALAPALGLTEEQVDAMFIQAAALEV
jgi:hypothetical protein